MTPRPGDTIRPPATTPDETCGAPAPASRYQHLRKPPVFAYSVTARQCEALLWVARGSTARQGADRMAISIDTFNSLLRKARRKLGARSSPHAVALAMESGLITLRDPVFAADESVDPVPDEGERIVHCCCSCTSRRRRRR